MDLVVGASSNAVKSLVGKLGSLLAQEYTLIQGVSDDIQYINDELASMQAFLNRTKRVGSHDEQRQDWVKQVREVSYDIEDCVGDVKHRLDHEPRGTGKLMYFRKKWYLLTTVYARRCIATEIRNLKARAQHVSDRRTRYGVESLMDKDGSDKAEGTDGPTDRVAPPPELIGTKQPVGVEDAMNELGGWFKKEEHNTQQSTGKRFLAIFGFGGLGKTTLALELHRKFGDDFDCRAIVQASQKFNLLMLLRSLVKQFHEQQASASQTDTLDGIGEWDEKRLNCKLVDQLKNTRYLVLVDDIWSVSAWENINDSLPERVGCGNIVVTTRFKSVAVACCRRNGRLYDLKPLPEKNSYKLFHQIISSAPDNPTKAASDGQIISGAPDNPTKAASDGQIISGAPDNPTIAASDGEIISGAVDNPTKAVSDGQIISGASDNPTGDAIALLKKCGGLPLAIIVVAGLVASKLRSGTSSKTLDNHLGEVDKALSGGLGTHLSTEGVTKILDHCYNDLPADLKTCLLYLSMFPKGCFVSRKRLIRRWIAEGFIIEKHGKTTEEVAEDYFNELTSRNLIRAVNNSSNGKVKNYQIHDMVLEYIISKSSYENFITVVGGHWQTSFPSYKVRRLSVHRSVHEEKGTVERMKLSHVRSLSAFESIEALHSCLHKFQILQVLDLECCKGLSSHQLIKKICKMYQLKYLSLCKTDIEEIPSEIGRLEYLEVLDIRETKVEKLPPSVEGLKRMTHLLTGSKSKQKTLTLTEEITKMTSLQILSGMGIRGRPTAATGLFKVARSGSSEGVLRALQKLTNLKKLSIFILGKLEEADKALLLSAIEHLSSCSLKFLAIDDDFTGFLDNSLSSSKAPPEHLHTLELSGKLSEVPMWIVSLHSLEKLTLSLTSLSTKTLMLLGELPELFSLTFSLDATKSRNETALKILHKNILNSAGEIFVPAGDFKKLKLLRFLAPLLPPLSFLEGAMPELQRLELRFRTADGVHGLENLASLRQVFLTVSSKAPKAAEEIKRLASKIEKNPPTVIIDEYNESSIEQ